MALATIATNKHYLLNPQGKPFFAMGINYAGYFDRAWKMWEPDLFDPSLIAQDFKKTRESGFNTIRLFAHTALVREIQKDNFDKLDQVLSLAQDHDLLVLMTLNDSHSLNLESVNKVDAKVAARYKNVPTIFAYDLENEPVFYNLIAAIYPEDHHPPVHTSQLVDHYGERVSRTEALELQRNRRIPGHLDEDTAYYYINALKLFLEYDAAVSQFTKQGKGTLIDFMRADEANHWFTLIGVLDDTVDAWIKVRMAPFVDNGDQHLLTVGWSWLHFAALPANKALHFQSYHNYGSHSTAGFNANVSHLEGLRGAFSKQPLIFSEFGWSNQSSREPANSRPVPVAETALYEAATYAYLRANNCAGGFKWMLNDVAGAPNPYESNFGVFSPGNQAKPIRDLVRRFSQEWPRVDKKAEFKHLRDAEAGISYRLTSAENMIVGGHTYQDEAVSWQAQGIAHCFMSMSQWEILVDAVGAGRLSVDPWDVLPDWNQAANVELYRVISPTQRTLQHTFDAGQSVVFDVHAGAQYAIAMGEEIPVEPPPDDGVKVDPKPGEHVILFGDFDTYLHTALQYLRRFTPDFTFAIDKVAGRWPYVTVVASTQQVSDQKLDDIRGAGAVLVERVVKDTPEATQVQLDDMAARGQRFLSAVVPPQEEPPTDPPGTPDPPDPPDPPTPPEEPPQETYIVQPGDTLGKIAKDIYGSFNFWHLIYEANRDIISNPSLIRPGMELRLPEKP